MAAWAQRRQGRWRARPMKLAAANAVKAMKITRLTALARTGVRVSLCAWNIGMIVRTEATAQMPPACQMKDRASSLFGLANSPSVATSTRL